MLQMEAESKDLQLIFDYGSDVPNMSKTDVTTPKLLINSGKCYIPKRQGNTAREERE